MHNHHTHAYDNCTQHIKVAGCQKHRGANSCDTALAVNTAAKKTASIKLLGVLVVGLLSMLLLTACTQKEESTHLKAAQSEAGAANSHSQKYLDIITDLKKSSAQVDGDMDINQQFIQVMRSHQQAAVMMAYIQLKHGKDADARSIAQRSIDIQQAQMSWMDQWLSFYTPKDSVQSADQFVLSKPSSQHFQSMTKAAQQSSPDQAFILLMQLHQSQTLAMIKQADVLALDAEVQALAEDIYDTQSAQIQQMEAWLNKHQH